VPEKAQKLLSVPRVLQVRDQRQEGVVPGLVS
jgi:hypothetical protein